MARNLDALKPVSNDMHCRLDNHYFFMLEIASLRASYMAVAGTRGSSRKEVCCSIAKPS
jgi:hypothetical protein